MTEPINSSAELRNALQKKGVTNGLRLAKFLDCEAVIFFLRGKEWGSARAELRLLDTGEVQTFRALPDDERVRESCVDRAVEAAREATGVYEWSKAPFSNCWLPSDAVEDLHEEFEEFGNFDDDDEDLPHSA